MDDTEQHETSSWRPGDPYPDAPAAPDHTQLPHRPTRRRWPLIVGVVVLVLALAAAGTGLAFQRSRLTETRADLAALRTAQASSLAQVNTSLNKSLTDQQQKLSALSGRLATTENQLQAAQARLTADEQQLNVTTQKLPPDLTQLATKVSPSVVLVTCIADTTVGTGTAFALDVPTASGYATTLITAAHVVSDCADAASNPVLTLSSGSRVWDAHIRGLDTDSDVAILDTTAKLPTLGAANSAPVVGEFVMVVGNPLGIVVNNVTSGNISQVYETYVLDTAPISNGNSGGPVVDREGNVVGIVQGAATPDETQPVVENLNVSRRLSSLCLSLMRGASCSLLH